MLWLQQFIEFEVAGILNEQLAQLPIGVVDNYEIVLYFADRISPQDIANLRLVKHGIGCPSIILAGRLDGSGQYVFNDVEAKIHMDAPLKTLCEQIKKQVNKRNSLLPTLWLPAAKAS